MAGAPPVSWAGTRVVKAATELTLGQKFVYLELCGLCGENGAYMSAENLGRRIAMTRDYIEQVRRELTGAALLRSERRPGQRGATWWPVLPAECLPTSRRPSDEEVVTLAARLDAHIRRARGSTEAPPGAPVVPTKIQRGPSTPRLFRDLLREYQGVPQPASEAGDSGVPEPASVLTDSGVPQPASEGGKGGDSTLSASTLQEVGTTSLTPPPPSAPPSERGEEVGPFAHERGRKTQGEVGVERNSKPAANGWRGVSVEPSVAEQPNQIRDGIRADRRAIDEEFRAEQAQARIDRGGRLGSAP
jgi:hypothetical protein